MKNKTGVFLNKADDESVITLRGPVLGSKSYFEDEGDYICPKTFNDALKACSGDRVKVIINSQGGDVFAAVEIYNALKECEKEVTTVISGRAFSGGHIIAMAGDTRLIHNNSLGLAHRASTIAWGNALELLETIDWLEKIDENIMNIYMDYFTGTREELGALLDKDKPISAEECVELGFATGIIGKEDEGLVAAASKEVAVTNDADIDELVNLVVERLNEQKKADNKTENEPENKSLFKFFKEDR